MTRIFASLFLIEPLNWAEQLNLGLQVAVVLTPELDVVLKRVRTAAQQVAAVSASCGLEV